MARYYCRSFNISIMKQLSNIKCFDFFKKLCVAVQSCVYREYRSGLRTQPCGAPVLRIRGDDVLLPILTT